jgi:pimeloyl-ACP methyl ester carboxylesterase
VAAAASPYASYACVDTWLTDFREELPNIDIPTLVVHGTADRTSHSSPRCVESLIPAGSPDLVDSARRCDRSPIRGREATICATHRFVGRIRK